MDQCWLWSVWLGWLPDFFLISETNFDIYQSLQNQILTYIWISNNSSSDIIILVEFHFSNVNFYTYSPKGFCKPVYPLHNPPRYPGICPFPRRTSGLYQDEYENWDLCQKTFFCEKNFKNDELVVNVDGSSLFWGVGLKVGIRLEVGIMDARMLYIDMFRGIIIRDVLYII